MTGFAGTSSLAWIAMRRDWLQLSIWVAGLTALMAGFASVMGGVFDGQRELEQAITVFAANPVVRAFGLASGATLGGLVMLRVFALFAVLVGLMSAMVVVRHTRQNDETRRTELIASTAVGRHAGLLAALIVAAAANTLLAALIAGALVVNGLPMQGAAVAGAALGAVGLAFAGVAAVTAQVSESARGAMGLAAIVIGIAFLLSSVGNVFGSAGASGVMVEPAWPAWLSPIGWGQLTRPFGGDQWWVLGLLAGWFAATVSVALALEGRRDVGRGLLPERRGPATAPDSLLSRFGLAWRLQRGTFLGWAAGVTVFGAVFGAVSNAFEDIVRDVGGAAEFFARIGGTEHLTEAFFATIIGLVGTVIGAYTVQGLLRMRAEEADGLVEPLLATALSRSRWMLAHVTVITLGTLALLLLTGLSAGVISGLAIGALGEQVPSLTIAALVQAPALLVLAGVVVATFGLAPRLAGGVSWAAFTVALVAGPMIGALLELPGLVLDLSPFTHVPAIPAEGFSAGPVAVLLLIAVLLGAFGLMGFRRRDLALQVEAADGRLPFIGSRTHTDEKSAVSVPS